MLSLQDREWAPFYVLDYFEVNKYPGSENNMASMLPGSTPLISAKNSRNGLKTFVTADPQKIKPAGVITWNKDGDGGAGLAFYQPFSFAADSHIFVLSPREHLSAEVCIFISTILSQFYGFFGHGRANSLSRIKKTRIQLPIGDYNEPDWLFMEVYIKERQQQLLQKYIRFIDIANQTRGGQPVEAHEWNEFLVSDIFDIKPGKRLTKSDMIPGIRPFIGATEANNGVTNFVSNTNVSLDRNVLGVNYNGSVVENFYHPYECIFSDDVKRFQLKNKSANKYVYLFMKSVILQQKNKYAYGYKFNEERMRKQKILLPVDDAGKPNWAYMENYGRQLIQQQIRTYLEYLQRNQA